MDIDLDTFLTALYCAVDDVYRAEFAPAKPRRFGHRPDLSDSEVLTLKLLAQWQGDRSERAFLRYVTSHWRGYFPRVLHPSAFCRRGQDLGIVLAQLGPAVVHHLVPVLLAGSYEVLDGLPVPLMRRCRGDRHRLFADEAGIGRGGSDRDWYYGVKLVAAVSPTGIITGFVVAPANTEERWAVDALLTWRLDPTAPAPTAQRLAAVLGPAHRRQGQRQGPTRPMPGRFSAGHPLTGWYLADEGERGDTWRKHWWEDDAAAVTPLSSWKPVVPSERHPALTGCFHALRQIVETVYASLTDRFGIKFPRARTPWGLVVRLAAKVAAHDIALALNASFHRPLFTIFNPLTE